MHVTMARLRLYALTTVGGLSLAYQLLTEATSPQGPSLSGLAWIVIYIPMYVVGVWLTWRLPSHPQPLRLLVGGTAFLAAEAFTSLIDSQPQLITSPWFPVLSMVGLELSAVGILATALLIGGYPDGLVERTWQRVALRCCWVVLLAAPLALLASPVAPVSPWVDYYGVAVPNPYALSWLGWLAEPALTLAVENWWPTIVGVVVLCARFVAADAAGRARMRFMFLVLVIGLTLWTAGGLASEFGVRDDSALVITLTALGALTVALIPVAIVYGILRHRLFDLDLVVRKSVAYGTALLLIAAAYAVIAATPGLMLGNRVPVALAVFITIAAALAFQPLRRRLDP